MLQTLLTEGATIWIIHTCLWSWLSIVHCSAIFLALLCWCHVHCTEVRKSESWGEFPTGLLHRNFWLCWRAALRPPRGSFDPEPSGLVLGGVAQGCLADELCPCGVCLVPPPPNTVLLWQLLQRITWLPLCIRMHICSIHSPHSIRSAWQWHCTRHALWCVLAAVEILTSEQFLFELNYLEENKEWHSKDRAPSVVLCPLHEL